MVDRRLCFIIFALGLCIAVSNGERARHDRLQPGEEREDDVVAENGNDQGDGKDRFETRVSFREGVRLKISSKQSNDF